jgi:hypothetical protein
VFTLQQLPTWTDALLDLVPARLAYVLSSNITAHLSVPPESRPVVTVNGYKVVLGSAFGMALQPWLHNTHISPLQQLVTHMGIVGEFKLPLQLIQHF